ncbi:MAG: RluA family pseudouridine synthase [Lachnospiraceae bacterium]|nr:RluA family pseudouridine synthase [Lachnospiraceae bacterium]
MQEITITGENSGLRIDKFLDNYFEDLSRSHIKKCLISGDILVNDKKVKAGYSLKENDRIVVKDIEPEEIDIKPQNIPLDIIYENDDYLIVNKPKNMVVHPAPGHYEDTLVNAIMYHCKDNLSGINGVIRPGIVHRIDKNTTGSLIVCKNDKAHNYIAKQIKEHSIVRRYIGIVYGNFAATEGIVDKPIGRSVKDRKKMCVTEKNGKDAYTSYRVISQCKEYSLVEFELKTGRTHQIRVHMASINHPIVGDDVYGPKKIITTLKGVEIVGQCLHARTIGFIDLDKNYVEFQAPLPEYMETLIKKLGLTQETDNEQK